MLSKVLAFKTGTETYFFCTIAVLHSCSFSSNSAFQPVRLSGAQNLPVLVTVSNQGLVLAYHGERLKSHVPLSLADAHTIAGQLAEALNYAQAQGLVHCAAQPDNVAVEQLEQGLRATLLDFSDAVVARLCLRIHALSFARTFPGAPIFPEPPQVEGHLCSSEMKRLNHPPFRPPEFAQLGFPISSAADVFSYGHLYMYMISPSQGAVTGLLCSKRGSRGFYQELPKVGRSNPLQTEPVLQGPCQCLSSRLL